MLDHPLKATMQRAVVIDRHRGTPTLVWPPPAGQPGSRATHGRDDRHLLRLESLSRPVSFVTTPVHLARSLHETRSRTAFHGRHWARLTECSTDRVFGDS